MMMFRSFGWLRFGMVFLVAAASGRAQATDPRINKIMADWDKRQNAVDSIRYEVKGQRITPRGSMRSDTGAPLAVPAPEKDIVGDVKWSMLLDFVNGRHRHETAEQLYDQKSQRFYPRVGISAGNGTIVKSAMPREQNTSEVFTPPATRPDLAIVTGNMRGIPFNSEYMPLFFAHGIIRTSMEEVVPGKLRGKTNPDYLVFHGQGVHGGVACQVVRTQSLKLSTTSFDEFWVDPARDSAIVRYVMYSGKHIFNDIDMQYQKTPHGWLPKQWVFTHYSGTTPSVIHRMHVESWLANPGMSDADFDIPIAPGMIVEETVVDESNHPLVNPKSATRVYRYGEGGDKTEIPDPFGRPRFLHKQTNWWYWAAGGVVVIIAAGVVIWRLRRNRGPSSATPMT